MNKRPLKIITTILITSTFLLNNLVWGAPVSYNSSNNLSLLPQNTYQYKLPIIIPGQYGTVDKKTNIQNTIQESKLPTIILIKDAHCNYEAQTNISKILKVLVRKYGVNLVAIEGASGDLDLGRYGESGDYNARKQALDTFVKKGIIAGPELLNIAEYNKLSFGLYGIEDSKLYAKNLISFKETWGRVDESERFLSEISDICNDLKTKIYSEKLLNFDRNLMLYSKGEMALTDWVLFLNNENSKLNKDKYQNFNLILKAIELEEKIDFKKVENERNKLLDSLERKLPKEDLEKLVRKSLEFKLGNVSQVEYYSFIEQYINKDLYNLSSYITLVKLQSGINNSDLFMELDSITDEIKSGLHENEIQKKIDNVSHNLLILGKLFHLKLSSKEMEYYKKNRSEFKIESIVSLISVQAKINDIKIPEYLTTQEAVAKINESILPADEFYRFALKRDEVLLNNTLKKMADEGQKTAVMVVGGFHSKGLIELMKQKGINYLTISPNITKNQSNNPYLDLMLNKDLLSDNMNALADMLAVPEYLAESNELRRILPGLDKLGDFYGDQLLTLIEQKDPSLISEMTGEGGIGKQVLIERSLAVINTEIGSLSGVVGVSKAYSGLLKSLKEYLEIQQRIASLEVHKEIIKKGEYTDTIVFGDKHGESDDLEEILKKARIAKGNGTKLNIVSLGDVFDKGENNLRNWEILKELKQIEAVTQGRVSFAYILGNHEYFAIRYILLDDHDIHSQWILNGGAATMEDVGDDKLEEFAMWILKNSKLFHIDERRTMYIHSGVPNGISEDTIGNLFKSQRQLEDIQEKLGEKFDKGKFKARLDFILQANFWAYWTYAEEWINNLIGENQENRVDIDGANKEKLYKLLEESYKNPPHKKRIDPGYTLTDGEARDLFEKTYVLLLIQNEFFFKDKGIEFKVRDYSIKANKKKLDNLLFRFGVNGLIFAHIRQPRLLNLDNRVICVDVEEWDHGHLILSSNNMRFKAVKRKTEDIIAQEANLIAGILEEIIRLKERLGEDTDIERDELEGYSKDLKRGEVMRFADLDLTDVDDDYFAGKIVRKAVNLFGWPERQGNDISIATVSHEAVAPDDGGYFAPLSQDDGQWGTEDELRVHWDLIKSGPANFEKYKRILINFVPSTNETTFELRIDALEETVGAITGEMNFKELIEALIYFTQYGVGFVAVDELPELMAKVKRLATQVADLFGTYLTQEMDEIQELGSKLDEIVKFYNDVEGPFQSVFNETTFVVTAPIVDDQSGGLIGSFKDTDGNVIMGIEAFEEGGELVLKKDGKVVEDKDGILGEVDIVRELDAGQKNGFLRMLLREISQKEDEMPKGMLDYIKEYFNNKQIKIIAGDNIHIRGFGNSETVYLTESLLNNRISLFHELGEGFFATGDNSKLLPPGVNSHTALRGLGKEARKVLKKLIVQDLSKYEDVDEFITRINDRMFSLYKQNHVKRYDLTEVEEALIRHNHTKAENIEQITFGIQDWIFGRDNITLTDILSKDKIITTELNGISQELRDAFYRDNPAIRAVGLNDMIGSDGSKGVVFESDINDAGYPVAVKVRKNPDEEWVKWEEAVGNFVEEIEKAELLSENGVGAHFYGVVDTGINPGYAVERIKGVTLQDLSPNEAIEFITEQTISKIIKTVYDFVEKGYLLEDLQIMFVTEDGNGRKRGDFVIIDPEGVVQLDEETNNSYVFRVARIIEMDLRFALLQASIEKQLSEGLIESDLSNIHPGLREAMGNYVGVEFSSIVVLSGDAFSSVGLREKHMGYEEMPEMEEYRDRGRIGKMHLLEMYFLDTSFSQLHNLLKETVSEQRFRVQSDAELFSTAISLCPFDRIKFFESNIVQNNIIFERLAKLLKISVADVKKIFSLDPLKAAKNLFGLLHKDGKITENELSVLEESAKEIAQLFDEVGESLPEDVVGNIGTIQEVLTVHLAMVRFNEDEKPEFVQKLKSELRISADLEGYDENKVCDLVDEIYEMEGYRVFAGETTMPDRYELTLKGLCNMLHIKDGDKAYKYLKMLDEYKYRLVQAEESFNVADEGFVSERDEVYNVLSSYLKLGNKKLLSRMAKVIARYMAYPEEDIEENEILSLFNDDPTVKKFVREGLEKIISRKGLKKKERPRSRITNKISAISGSEIEKAKEGYELAGEIVDERTETVNWFGDIEVITENLVVDIKAAVFDFDGTLADTESIYQEIEEAFYRDVFIEDCGKTEKDAVELAKEFFTDTCGWGNQERVDALVKRVREQGGTPRTGDEYHKEWKRRARERFEQGREELQSRSICIPGIKKLLDVFRDRNIYRAVASAGNPEIKILQSDIFGLLSYIDEEDIFGFPEKKEVILQRIMQDKTLEPHQTVMFGDMPNDIKAAKEAGCVAVGIAKDAMVRESLIEAGADIIIMNNWRDRDSILNVLVDTEASGKEKSIRERIAEESNWNKEMPLLIEAELILESLGAGVEWLIREAAEDRELLVLYNEDTIKEQGTIESWIKGLGVSADNIKAVEEYPKEYDDPLVCMLTNKTVGELKSSQSISDKHRVVKGRSENDYKNENDLMLMSNIAAILSGPVELMEDRFGTLYYAYYDGILDSNEIDQLVKDAVAAVEKGIEIIIELPEMVPFIKPFYNTLKRAREKFGSAA